MIHHIVMWRFLDHVPAAERSVKGKELKIAIEGLADKIPGVIELHVAYLPVGTSTHDLLLVSKFESMEALDGYQVHPAHVAVAQMVKEVAGNRACFDYET